MTYESELEQEQLYAAQVQQLLYTLIKGNRSKAAGQDDIIGSILADAWDELRTKPQALSRWEKDQLDAEVSRYAALRSYLESRAADYERMLSNPYFARIDFTEDGEQPEKIVIGLYSLRSPDGHQLVHDWRAPICGLYYDAVPGKTSFDSPGGKVVGTLRLKRQYGFEHARLKYFVDTDYSIDDGMLLDILSGASGTHMKQIVSTIQSEQNRAIRHDTGRVLSVTGGAGSGKTSVAMHRAAYLLYKHRDKLDARRIVVLSPTNAFSEYISTVLPELGEENTKTMTLTAILSKLLARKIEPQLNLYEALVSGNALRRQSVAYKADGGIIELMEKRIRRFEEEGVAFADAKLGEKILMSAEEQRRLYSAEKGRLTASQRLNRVRVTLESRMEEAKENLYERVENQLIDSYKNKALVYATKIAVSQKLGPVKQMLRDKLQIDPLKLFAEAMQDAPKELAEAAEENRKAGLIWQEDAPAIAYILLRLGEVEPDKNILHLLVDEAQDYTDMALRLMNLYFPNANVTLLGDPNQRTLPALPECHPENWGGLFGEPEAKHYVLTRGYRSTKDIADFCAAFLPEGSRVPVPVERRGSVPTVEKYNVKNLEKRLNEWLESGVTRVAVITRNNADAQSIARAIKGSFLLTGDENELEDKGITVGCLPFMKGLEFDAVAVVWDLQHERDDSEKRQLYTSCTRALHTLALFDTSAQRKG